MCSVQGVPTTLVVAEFLHTLNRLVICCKFMSYSTQRISGDVIGRMAYDKALRDKFVIEL
jgi:hypothetical protein